METRLLLIDTDIFILLAAAGLLERVAELLGFSPSEMRRLPPLESQLTRGKTFKKKFSAAVLHTALMQAKAVQPINERPANDALTQNLAIADIDPGENLMFALMAENSSWMLTTGDRRSLVALAQEPKLGKVRAAVAGRLVCLETVLRLLVTQDGVGKVAAAFSSVRDCDTKLRVIFSEANETNIGSCLEGIDSYLTSLKREVGEGFLYEPKSDVFGR